MSRRLNDMDAAGVDVQVLSNTPQTFLYHQEGALAAALSAIQNDQSARAVAGNPGRLVGIATLPMQVPELAAAELRRAMGKLELKGAQIGSNIHGRNLDDAGLEPLWAAANELDAFIMVHPTGVAGAERLKSYLDYPDISSQERTAAIERWYLGAVSAATRARRSTFLSRSKRRLKRHS